MLWFYRQDSRAFVFCSHWKTRKIKKSHLFQMEKDFCKNIHQALTPNFPVPGEVCQGHVLKKSTGTSLALWASSELAILHAAAPSLQQACHWAAWGDYSWLWEPSHAHWEMGFFVPLWPNPLVGPYRPPNTWNFKTRLSQLTSPCEPQLRFPSFQFRRTEMQQTAT